MVEEHRRRRVSEAQRKREGKRKTKRKKEEEKRKRRSEDAVKKHHFGLEFRHISGDARNGSPFGSPDSQLEYEVKTAEMEPNPFRDAMKIV